MKMISAMLFAAVLLGGASSLSALQSSPAAHAAAPRIPVHAPFAEQMIVKLKAEHPEIQKLSMHAVPPGQTQWAIIASNYPKKVGKLSSPSDLQTVHEDQPVVHRIEKGHFWDTFVPVHGRHGKIIGFLVMEVPFKTASTRAGAIAEGIRIRNQVQHMVPNKEILFGPAR